MIYYILYIYVYIQTYRERCEIKVHTEVLVENNLKKSRENSGFYDMVYEKDKKREKGAISSQVYRAKLTEKMSKKS